MWLRSGTPTRKIGGSKWEQGVAKGYTTAKAGISNTQAAAQDAARSILDQVAGMPAAAQALEDVQSI
jgi:hypothetical protein